MSARSLNKVMLIGNLTRDPNLRYTPNGTAVCSFGLATNRSWSPADGGERQERVEFHNVVAWGKLAEICGQLLHKGDKSFVEGRLQTRDWKTNEGEDRRTTEIVIDNMMLLNSRGGTADADMDYGDQGDYSDESMGEDTGSKSKKAAKPVKKSKTSKSDDKVSDDDASDAEDVSDEIPF